MINGCSRLLSPRFIKKLGTDLADSLTQFYIHRAVVNVFNTTLQLTDVPLAINILMELEFLVH